MKTALELLPFPVLLFVLPFPGAVTVRLTSLAAAFLIAVTSRRRVAPPPFPCKWAIALWAGVVIASLHFAVDPAYSLREVRSEVSYALMAFVAFFAWTRDEQRLRLSCLAVLAGFVVISSSALLGADLRNGEWPTDVYYGDVGGVSKYLVHGRPSARVDGGASWPWTFEHVVGRRGWAVPDDCAALRSTCSVACDRATGCISLRLAVASSDSAYWPAAAGVDWRDSAGPGWRWNLRQRPISHRRQSRLTSDDGERSGPRVWKKVGEEILAHPLTGAGFGRDVMGKAYPALLPPEDTVFWHPSIGTRIISS